DLFGERVRAGRRRIGVGHLEHGCHAAVSGRARPGLEILLMNEAWLAKMHLRIDDAGKDVKAAAVDAFARRGAAQSADLGDPTVTDTNVARADPILVDYGSVDQEAIEAGRHGGSFLQQRKSGLFDSLRPCKRDRSCFMHKKAATLEDRGVVSVTGAD